MHHEAVIQLALPAGEAEAFCDSLSEALRLAQSGRVLRGYEALIEAQQRAQERCSTPASGSTKLAGCYGDALTDYREVFGIPLN
jgi:hypothetical protein